MPIKVQQCLALLVVAAALLALPSAVSGRRSPPPWNPEDSGAHASHTGYLAAMSMATAGQYVEATTAFRSVAQQERGTAVGAWALLQAGICSRTAGNLRQAGNAWEEVARNYPETHVANLATEELRKFRGDPEPAVPQPPPRDPHCGPKALARVCQALGIEVALEELVNACAPGPAGASFADLASAAEQLGLKAEGVHVNIAALRATREPAIAWVNRNHYVAVLKGGDRLIVFDPNQGQDRRVSLTDFSRDWDGYLLLLARKDP
jgi:hypothetical protein